jgi:hypothetical protein
MRCYHSSCRYLIAFSGRHDRLKADALTPARVAAILGVAQTLLPATGETLQPPIPVRYNTQREELRK